MVGPQEPVLVFGRYAIYGEIASGGMATVHFGRQLGSEGFARTVAIKRLHASYAKDPHFVTMFLDEGRLVARIRHPNVVPTLDVVAQDGELFIVMEYVQGESLARLLHESTGGDTRIGPEIACPIVASVLHGLHAAHEATNERGDALGIVHRDVSPHNVLVGLDGVARILDFGVAKAAGRVTTTSDGRIKGKVPYMPPEQILGSVDRRADIYAAGVVLWEALSGRRLFRAQNEAGLIAKVLAGKIPPPSEFARGLPPALVELTMRALSREPGRRFSTAREMARALEKSVPFAVASDIGEWVDRVAGRRLALREEQVREIEIRSRGVAVSPTRLGEPRFSSVMPAHDPHPSDTIPQATPMGGPEVVTRPLADEVSTQLSSGSVSSPRDAPVSPPPRRPPALALLGGAGALVSVLALAWLFGSRGAPPSTAASIAARTAAPTASPALAAAEVATAPAAEAPEAEVPTGSVPEPRAEAPVPQGTASGSSSAREHEPAPPRRPLPSSPARHINCNPAFTLDGSGFKHYKPECMD